MNEKNEQEKNVTGVGDPGHIPDARELTATALKIREWQKERKPPMSDSEICRKYPALGSTKTYQKCREGDVADLDVVAWLAKYQAVAALIESGDDSQQKQEVFWDDLTPVLEVRGAVAGVMKQTDNARFVLVQGDTGSGKTGAMNCVLKRYPEKRFYSLQAFEAWNDAPASMLGGMLRRMGVKDLPYRCEARLEMLLEKLPVSTRTGWFIDEGHHLGPQCLNTVKALLNVLPGEIVIFSMHTLWQRIERASWDEVKQLTKNRMYERVILSGITHGDVRKFVERRMPSLSEADKKQAIPLLLEKAKPNGNFAFVRNVCNRIERGDAKEQLTIEAVADAVAQELRSR